MPNSARQQQETLGRRQSYDRQRLAAWALGSAITAQAALSHENTMHFGALLAALTQIRHALECISWPDDYKQSGVCLVSPHRTIDYGVGEHWLFRSFWMLPSTYICIDVYAMFVLF